MLTNKPQQGNVCKDAALLADQELQESISRMFNNWCWISGDPDEKRYYDQLLAEADQRKVARAQERGA